MTRGLAVLLFALVVIGAAAYAAPEDLPAPGTTWKYSYRDQQFGTPERSFSVEAQAVDGDKVREIFRPEGGDVTQAVLDAREPAFVSRRLAESASLVELAP